MPILSKAARLGSFSIQHLPAMHLACRHEFALMAACAFLKLWVLNQAVSKQTDKTSICQGESLTCEAKASKDWRPNADVCRYRPRA